MKAFKVCCLTALLWGPGLVLMSEAAPKTQAQRNHERAQLRAAQRQSAQNSDQQKAWRREQQFRADRRETARDHRNDRNLGDDIARNAEEAKDTLHGTGRQIRDWFGW